MTIQELATNYNMHDSLIDSFSVDDQEKTIRIIIDFAFWMQDNYSEGDPETGPLNVTFLNVSNYSVPEQLPLDEISILKTSVLDNAFVFTILNDITDECFDIRIKADSVMVS